MKCLFYVLFIIAFFTTCSSTKPSLGICSCSNEVKYSLVCKENDKRFDLFLKRIKVIDGVDKLEISSEGIVTLQLKQAFFDDKVNLGYNFNYLIFNDIYKSFFRFRKIKGVVILLDNLPYTLLPIVGDYEIHTENNIMYREFYFNCMDLSAHITSIDSLLIQSKTNEIPNDRIKHWNKLLH